MKQKKNDPDVFDIMRQKKNYWTWCKDCSPFWIYCKDCDEYHTFEEVPCVQELAIKKWWATYSPASSAARG